MLLLGAAGCGSKGTESGDAYVTPEPNANVPTVSTTAPAPSSGSSNATAPAAAPAAAGSPTAPAAAPVSAATGGWGTLKGKVTLKGNAPKPKELFPKGAAPKDPEVCGKDSPVVSERLIVEDGTKGVKNVLVYIPKVTGPINEEAKSGAASAQLVFDQEKCVFVPHVLPLMVGAKVELKNSDPVSHNINSRLRQNGFNEIVPATKSTSKEITAAERSPGELTCDIYNWMKAYWLVIDSPYFAVTDEHGDYEIKNIPAGSQKVVVWQEAVAKGFVTAPSGDAVDVKANDTQTKDFTIDAAKLLPE